MVSDKATLSDTIPAAIDWPDFDHESSSPAFTDIDERIEVEVTVAHSVGTPTYEVRRNSEPYRTISPGSPIQFGIELGDTLSFRVDGDRSEAGTFTVINKSDSDTVLDTSIGTVRGFNYFVITDSAYTGNLGGLAGADALCLTDLQANDWQGKNKVLLNSTTVTAFLCDSTTCQNPAPNKTHFFAHSGNAIHGGESFVTDANGHGPGNTVAWSSNNYFGTSDRYWSGRTSSADAIWDSDLPGGNHCNDWSNGSSGNGRYGYPIVSDDRRWRFGSDPCTNGRHLVCIVND